MTTPVKTGIDIIEENDFSLFKNKSIGLLVNPASTNCKLNHTAELFLKGKGYSLKALFGPQHGIYGNTQDNMIEWESFLDSRWKLPVYSLYGETRKPTPEMLEGIDTLVIDLPDIGARYYTFVWTAKLCMEACREKGIEVVVLDRPNPINGVSVEGPQLNPDYKSFVGLSCVPVRHGLTMGELLNYINKTENIGCALQIVKLKNWKRHMWFDQTKLPWVLPSPNMPALETAIVYPGGCLLEASHISEGRGTCRPFEIIGAPYIDPHKLTAELRILELEGVYFRPLYFQPVFNKYSGQLCGGIQLHVTCRNAFKSVKTYALLLSVIKKLYPDDFAWKAPPYEYEYEKMPIDILWGDSQLRETIDSGKALHSLFEKMESDSEEFLRHRETFSEYN